MPFVKIVKPQHRCSLPLIFTEVLGNYEEGTIWECNECKIQYVLAKDTEFDGSNYWWEQLNPDDYMQSNVKLSE